MISGLTMLPDGGGLFIRGQEFSGGADNDPSRTSSSTIATMQTDEFKEHSHNAVPAGQHAHSVGVIRNSNGSGGYIPAGTAGNPIIDTRDWLDTDDTFAVNNEPGGIEPNQIISTNGVPDHVHEILANGFAETRPKNLNFWIYIRIN
jgi:hypothetical protein